ncbi:BnaA09g08920D [Brassica napus]|uniref:(rape) hypothetical protein n=1 Tax=Brassica napus TaxID=3708 RepID=A0A078IE91_BRANA|nr:unnamed protein product [Brassica napus]CDY47483.1 BnaA09g08920D [Brassica napus]
MDEKLGGLGHILTTVFLSSFAGFLQVVITSTYIYVHIGRSLSLFSIFNLQSSISSFFWLTVGLGTMVMMPVIGNLADRYGIKALLTLPMCLSIIPPGITLPHKLAIDFSQPPKYLLYSFKFVCALSLSTYISFCQPFNHCLIRSSFYKKIIKQQNRLICLHFSYYFFCKVHTIFVTALSLFVGLVYMRIFLKERLHDDDEDDYDGGGDERMLTEPILENAPTRTHVFYNKYSSLKDMVALMKNSTILVQALAVTFFVTFSQSGMESAFLYFLKARFGFKKNDFAQLSLLVWIIGSISQLFILRILVSAIGERRVLSTGLLMDFFNAAILSVSWSPWVPYAATALVPGVMFVMPSIYGIASRQVGSGEQGKVQGCIYGVKSFAEVVAPFVYSPLTALFLSDNAPFYFPGFSLLCIALSLMIGFLLSLLIKDVPSSLMKKTISSASNEEA